MSVGTRPASRGHTVAAAERLRVLAGSEEPALWWSLFGLLLAAAAAVLYYETRDTTFWADEWTWALTRRVGALGTFLDAHNGHLSLVPVVIYKLLFATAGLREYAPYRAVLIVSQLACTTLVFVYARRRIGSLLALAVAALLLFFGPGWQDILWPFQIAWLFSIGAGVGALLLLDRADPRGRVGACALTAVALASSSVGVAFALGVLVDVVLGRRGRRHWWVAGGPLIAYALWSVGYQTTSITSQGLLVAPDFAFDAAASALAAVLGFGGGLDPALPNSGATLQGWGQPLLVAALLVVLWRVPRLGHNRTRAIALLSAGAAFWVFTGLTRWFISPPYVSRYLYVGAVIVLLLMVELAAGLRIAFGARVLAVAVALIAGLTNIGDMRTAAGYLRGQAQLTRAQLGALDIARPLVSPAFATGFLGIIHAGPYFAAERALGTPAATSGQLAGFTEPVREAADAELAAIQPLRLAASTAGPGAAPPIDAARAGRTAMRGSCAVFDPEPFIPDGVSAALAVTVPPGGLLLRIGPAPATVAYRRFGVGFQTLGTAAAGARLGLRIRPDRSSTAWHVQVSSSGPFSVCGLGP